MWVWIVITLVSVFYLGRCLLAVARAIEVRTQVDSTFQGKIVEQLELFVDTYFRTHLEICPACGKPRAEHGGRTWCPEHDPIRKVQREIAARANAKRE